MEANQFDSKYSLVMYFDEFVQAIQRSNAHRPADEQIGVPSEPKPKRLFQPFASEEPSNALRTKNLLRSQHLIGNCDAISAIMLEPKEKDESDQRDLMEALSDHAGRPVEVWLTTGYVEIDTQVLAPSGRHALTPSLAEEIIRDGDRKITDEEFHHTWITLDTMEVIDFTLAPSLRHYNIEVFQGEVAHQDILITPPGGRYTFKYSALQSVAVDYHPAVVGEWFLVRHNPKYRQIVDNLHTTLGLRR